MVKVNGKSNESFLFYRSIPSTNTQATAYQWPSSPILPPISSRTPHLVPETLIPTTTQQLAITNSSSINSTHNHHHKSAGSWMDTEECSEIQFHSLVQPRASSSSSSNKYTRQRERASRSLDKYWIARHKRYLQTTSFHTSPTTDSLWSQQTKKVVAFFLHKNSISYGQQWNFRVDKNWHASASTTNTHTHEKRHKNTHQWNLKAFSQIRIIDWQARKKQEETKNPFLSTLYLLLYFLRNITEKNNISRNQRKTSCFWYYKWN